MFYYYFFLLCLFYIFAFLCFVVLCFIIDPAQSELVLQLSKHFAFHAYVGETQHRDPGDTVKFCGVTRIVAKSA